MGVKSLFSQRKYSACRILVSGLFEQPNFCYLNVLEEQSDPPWSLLIPEIFPFQPRIFPFYIFSWQIPLPSPGMGDLEAQKSGPQIKAELVEFYQKPEPSIPSPVKMFDPLFCLFVC